MLADTLRRLSGTGLLDEDGKEQVLQLLPPASGDEIRQLEVSLPAPLPPDIREALLVSKGLDNGPLESLSLVDLGPFGLEEIFPHGWSIGHDGYGNYWVVDIVPSATHWGPIYYACHDPPVIVLQGHSVEEFLLAAVALWQPGPRSSVAVVHEDATRTIWRDHPGLLSQAELLGSADDDLRAFAVSLPPPALVADLRGATIGEGFAWGRFGPRTAIRRFGYQPIWAVEPPERKPGLLRRLLGGGPSR